MPDIRPFDLVLSKLGDRVVKHRDHFAECLCPAHDDKQPSLRVFEDASGNVGLKCWSGGCSTEAICSAIGIKPFDLFLKRAQHREKIKNPETKAPEFIGDVHRYVDEDGVYLFEKCKLYDRETCRKSTRAHMIRASIGDGYRYSIKAGWFKHFPNLWKRLDVKNDKENPPDPDCEWFEEIPIVLFFAYEVKLAREQKAILFWCEGEKDAQNVREQWHMDSGQPRFYATTKFDGANGRWRKDYIAAIKGVAEVVVVCDHDQAGYAWGEFVRKRLKQARIPHRIVRPLEGNDVTDHLAAGWSLAELVECDPAEELRIIQTELPPGKQTKRKTEFEDWRPPLNEIELAEVFVQEYGKDLRWCPPYKRWYSWDGRLWQADVVEDAMWERYMPLAKVIKDRVIGDDSKKFAERAQTKKMFENVEYMAKRFGGLQVLPTDMDSEPHLLPVANGLVDLATGDIHEHERSRFVTDVVPHAYNKSAKCPVFIKFLQEAVQGDMELFKYIQRAYGYSLTRTAREHIFFFLFGPPRSGKGRLVEALEIIMPDPMTRNLNKQHVMISKYPDRGSEHLARLMSCRVVTVKEVMGRDRLDEALVKMFTGEDVITAKNLYENPVDFRSRFKLWVQGNEQPQVTDQTGAVWMRMRVLPLTRTVPAEDRDKELGDKFRAEAEGILAWAISGAIEYFRDGLGSASVVDAATAEYQAQSDPVQEFLDIHVRVTPVNERLQMATHNTTGAKELYEEFCRYCKSVRSSATSNTTFGRQMDQRGYDKKRSTQGIRYWVTLVNTSHEDMEELKELPDPVPPDPFDD